jgi:hypothetical protein
MIILIAARSAVFRSIGSWKGVLILWFTSLLLVSMLAVPMRGALNTGFGTSTITEKLSDGIDIEVFADLGATFTSLVSYFSKGLFIVILTAFLLNTFLSGGLFNSLKGSSGRFSAGEFFRTSAKYFWSFLVISLITGIIAVAILIFIVILPVSLVIQAEIPVEGAVLKTCIICFSVLFLLLAVLYLVADYSRAWQVSNEKNSCFRAIGFGFSQTFRTFSSSYPLMIILLIVQFLFGWLVIKILPGIKPVTGTGVFLLFLLSQLLFYIKIMLKAWRYGSVTSLMEMNSYPPSSLKGF